ncbi:rhodanese-like domain-containing protein [Tropicimonas sp. TH_r6]|uniref:rhodanese-like domain-containing protein n=1 Tax=Tropicimonas sp. TH_r6 TaxID=3082085 RepID=UPI0029548EE6|nr:rhodanese-like domain-containing protein [Tropicimonas sp. TH_r6]MDV7144356.1 rhodanese-like domain-containing protein [Tropicimonas sp. TH_r6]
MLLTMLNPFGAGGETIDPTKAVTMIKKGQAVLVDVRETGEFAGGHASGAVNVPMGQVARMANPSGAGCLPELKAGKPVILYCASGARSGMAGKMFRKLGHGEVYNLGSLSDWSNAGGRVQR